MAITYKKINPTLIPNTNMEKGFLDGVHKIYRITPIDGYVLHDKGRDYELFDEIGNPILDENGEQIIRRGYSTNAASCGADYNFSVSQITIDDGSIVASFGSREFFAVLKSSLPAGTHTEITVEEMNERLNAEEVMAI